MNGNLAIDFRDPKAVRKVGLAALVKELGPTGTAYFIRQYDRGEGDYTKERREMADNLTHDEIFEGIKKVEKSASVDLK